MAVTQVQTVGTDQTTAASSAAVTFSSPVTNGNSILVSIVSLGGSSAPTHIVTDSNGNVYKPTGARQTISGLLTVEIYYASNVIGGSSLQVTVTPNQSSTISFAAGEYSAGPGTLLSLDSVNGSSGALSSALSCSGPVLHAIPELLVAVAGTMGNAGTITGTGGSWNERYNSGGVAGANDIEVQDYLAAATTQAPSWTTVLSLNWAACVVGFSTTYILNKPAKQRFDDITPESRAFFQRPRATNLPMLTALVGNIRIIQSSQFSNLGHPGSVTLPYPVTAGNLIVAVFNTASFVDTISADSLGNVYTKDVQKTGSIEILSSYSTTTSASGTLTFSWTGSSGFGYLSITEVAYVGGAIGRWAFDQGSGGDVPSSFTVSPGSITPTDPNYYASFLASSYNGATGSVSPSGWFSTIPSQAAASQGVFNSPSATNPTWTMVGATAGTACVLALYRFATLPPSKQLSQRQDPLPDYNGMPWQQLRRWPIPVIRPPDNPSTHQSSQRFDSALDFNYHPYFQERRWPIPVIRPPDNPSTHQSSQRFDPLPDLTANIWQQYRKVLPPSGYFTTQEGYAGIFTPFTTGEAGRAAVANNAVEGYAVFVGSGGMPDFTAPSGFSATLPVNVSVTPPGSGTITLWVVVRKVNKYGIYSQNQNPTLLVIDSSGNLVLPALLAPTSLLPNPATGNSVRIMAKYATYNSDPYPATQWKVWIDTVTPNTSNPPTLTAPVLSESLVVSLPGPYAAGTYFVSVALFRAADSQLSPPITVSVVIPVVPVKPTAVPGGFNTN